MEMAHESMRAADGYAKLRGSITQTFEGLMFFLRKFNRSLYSSCGEPAAAETYVTSAPSLQNALDIFKGEWATKLPGILGERFETGTVPAFEDPRIDWLTTKLGSVERMSVLELGPLEAGHTYMLERAAVARILAIEANKRAFLRCLVVKEALELLNARFICGDFLEYLRNRPPTFDLCLASGVLYHMTNPVELLELASLITDNLFIWTVYYDQDVMEANPDLAALFSAPTAGSHSGLAHTLYRHEYKTARKRKDFRGGNAGFCNWMSLPDILASLQYFGFDKIDVGCKGVNQSGPACAILARRTSSTG